MSSLPLSPQAAFAPLSAAPHSAQFAQLSPVLQFIPVQPAPLVVVPPSQPVTQVHRVINFQSTKSPTTFPPAKQEAQTTRTYASFHAEPVHELAKNESRSWALSLSVAVPSDLINPTLTSLVYYIKYATTHDNGNSTVQADVVLSTKPSPVGIVSDSSELGIYRSRSKYGSRMVDEDVALTLSSVPAVKCNGGNGQWSHYVDTQRLFPDVRIVDTSNLYLNFHVDEYPTTQTSRCLDVQVTASWVEDVAARKAKEEAERKAREDVERKAREEAARLAREEAERLAKEEAEKKVRVEAERKAREEAERKVREEAERKAKEEAERKAREELERKAREEAERKAREEAEKKAKEEAEKKAKEEAEKKAKEEADRKAKEEADRKAREEAERLKQAKLHPPSVKDAPKVADATMQHVIKEAAKAHGAECTGGFSWKKTSWGYECAGGGHRLTFEQLGMTHR